MLRTTLGQLLINEALPEDLRDYGRVLDKDGMYALLKEVALKHPDDYVDVSKKLADIGRRTSTASGGNSFGLAHMAKAKIAKQRQAELQAKVKKILDADNLNDKQRHELIIRETGKVLQTMPEEVYQESLQEGNPLAYQVLSGSRGNKMNLNELRGTGLLFADHRNQSIPLPILRSYSEGMSPSEYWAASYGARKGVMDVKFATQDAGFLSKQLNQVAHRLLVTDKDGPRRDDTLRGLPVATDDMDSEGALLAHNVGGYQAHTVLTPKILQNLQRQGHKKILVRSPLVGGSPDGGVYGYDVGVREQGTIPGRGSMVGLTAAQALSEPISQAQLGSKHTGGVAGANKLVSGFDYINQMIQVPRIFKGGATHAQKDGTVSSVEEAPAGGQYVWVDDHQHYVPAGYGLKVKKGDQVEAGDMLSDGAPNPSEVTRLKGIGEGKRYFVHGLHQAMTDAGMKANRRNIELLARGLINHVRLTDEYAGHLPDEVVPYSTLEHVYEPREDHEVVHPTRAIGKYLERPVLHYSIGTKVRPSVLRELQHFGVKDVAVHRDPPPFEPEMIRGMYSLQADPDWMTRMYGSGLKDSLLDAVHTGGKSDEAGTSFVPGLARAVDFGRVGVVRQPEPGIKPPAEGKPLESDMPTRNPAAITLPPPGKKQHGILGRMGSILKLSCDQATQLREAYHLLEKMAAREPGPDRRDMMQPDPPRPIPVRAPVPTPAPSAPPPLKPPTPPLAPPTRPPALPAVAPPAPPAQTAQTSTPGQVNPARQAPLEPWAAQGEARQGRNPYANYMGYAPSPGLFGETGWSPEQMSRFVAGGVEGMDAVGSSAQADRQATNPANAFSALARMAYGMDERAAGALTSGSPYVRGDYRYRDTEGLLKPPGSGGEGGGEGGYQGYDPWGQVIQRDPEGADRWAPWKNLGRLAGAIGSRGAVDVTLNRVVGGAADRALIRRVAQGTATPAEKVIVDKALQTVAERKGAQGAAKTVVEQTAKPAVTQGVEQGVERAATPVVEQGVKTVAEQATGQGEKELARVLTGQGMRATTQNVSRQILGRSLGRGMEGMINFSGGPLATPVNALFELAEHTIGMPTAIGGRGIGNPTPWDEMESGHREATSIDDKVFGFNDPTHGLLSTMGAAVNTWAQPSNSAATLFYRAPRDLLRTGSSALDAQQRELARTGQLNLTSGNWGANLSGHFANGGGYFNPYNYLGWAGAAGLEGADTATRSTHRLYNEAQNATTTAADQVSAAVQELRQQYPPNQQQVLDLTALLNEVNAPLPDESSDINTQINEATTRSRQIWNSLYLAPLAQQHALGAQAARLEERAAFLRSQLPLGKQGSVLPLYPGMPVNF